MLNNKTNILLLTFTLFVASCGTKPPSKNNFPKQKYDINKIATEIKTSIKSDTVYNNENTETTNAFKKTYIKLN